MSDGDKLTIPVEGVRHSEECGSEEKPGEMHKAVWRLWRPWVARGFED